MIVKTNLTNSTSEIVTISKVDVLRGRSLVNIDGLSDLLLEHVDHRLDDDPCNSMYEDSFCPESPIVDSIIEELEGSFYRLTGMAIKEVGRWSHIHEPNMSTNRHSHHPVDISAVYYVTVPKGSGKIVFYTSYNNFNSRKVNFQPEEKMFLMFPGTLDHSVSRNLSDTKRISLSFNFLFV
tara:strand:+ start:270 stop:809 length:540 start_codon:yes stop_codon:yes gene_type:complete